MQRKILFTLTFLFSALPIAAAAFTGYSPVPNGCIMSGIRISCPGASYTTRSNSATLQWKPDNGGYNGACATEACVSNVAFTGSSPIPSTNAFIQRNSAGCASTTTVTIAWVDSTTIQASSPIPTPGGVCNGAPLQIPQPFGPGPRSFVDKPFEGDTVALSSIISGLPVFVHNSYISASHTGATATFDLLLFNDRGALISQKNAQLSNGNTEAGLFAYEANLPSVATSTPGLYFLQVKSCVGVACGVYGVSSFQVSTTIAPSVLDPVVALKQCFDVDLLDVFNPFPGQQLHALQCSFNTVVTIMSGVPPFLWIKQISDVVSATTTPATIDATMHWPNQQAFTLYSSSSTAGITGVINNFPPVGGLSTRQWIETFLWLGFIGYAISIPYRLLRQ